MKNQQEKETDYIQKKLSEDDSENDSDYDSYGLLDVEDGNGKKKVDICCITIHKILTGY